MYIEQDISKKYLEQWARIQRHHKKIEGFSHGGLKQNDEEMLDIILSFFLHTYHLKDWIKRSVPCLKKDVEKLFTKNSTSMFICKNLTNGFKHLRINNSEKEPKTVIAHQSVTVYGGTEISRYTWDVSINGEKIDVYNLADDCIKQWMSFFEKHNLQLK